VLSLSDPSLTDTRLNNLLINANERTFILLEDIDAAFSTNIPVHPSSGVPTTRDVKNLFSQVTFSGLLNALDGVAAAEGRVLFMTTNYLNRLDPALVRPGRVDRMEFIGLANRDMIRKMYERFYPESVSLFDDILSGLAMEHKVSMAFLQGLFLQFKEDPRTALQKLHEHLETVEEHRPDHPAKQTEEDE